MFELDRWILVPRGNGATCFSRLTGEVKERSDVPMAVVCIYIYMQNIYVYIYIFIYIYIEYVRFVIEIMMLS
jgi:hypothetical protein